MCLSIGVPSVAVPTFFVPRFAPAVERDMWPMTLSSVSPYEIGSRVGLSRTSSCRCRFMEDARFWEKVAGIVLHATHWGKYGTVADCGEGSAWPRGCFGGCWMTSLRSERGQASGTWPEQPAPRVCPRRRNSGQRFSVRMSWFVSWRYISFFFFDPYRARRRCSTGKEQICQ